MLKGIDPLLGPELLAIAARHGPRRRDRHRRRQLPRRRQCQRLVRADGVERRARWSRRSPPSCRWTTSCPPRRSAWMVRCAGPDPAGHRRVRGHCWRAVGYTGPIEAIERHAFYARAREAYAIVATGEPRFWGNLILKKGAIAPGGGLTCASTPTSTSGASPRRLRLADARGLAPASTATTCRRTWRRCWEGAGSTDGAGPGGAERRRDRLPAGAWPRRRPSSPAWSAGRISRRPTPPDAHRGARRAEPQLVGLRPMLQDMPDPRLDPARRRSQPAHRAMADGGPDASMR